ncbi:hypothetical protein FocTR4_00005448 [Fusarium oxysporum f. sp. cubense]|uniref:Uncharacterized protein n=1 Tax=Fusarium oxysporum f. sp. cubense TaxID=61366 RepID=A0A5C6TLE7_FUSOC|nr:hypothetical protein FocTR4_00005448 [Fusarium oxysporum f. sp. cubense]
MTALENARLCVREKDSNAIVRVNKYRSEREGIELFSVTMQTPCLWNRKQGPGGEAIFEIIPLKLLDLECTLTNAASASKVPVWDLGSQVGIARQLMMGICGP